MTDNNKPTGPRIQSTKYPLPGTLSKEGNIWLLPPPGYDPSLQRALQWGRVQVSMCVAIQAIKYGWRMVAANAEATVVTIERRPGGRTYV